ncbi:acyl-CoA thioesterase [soil metagenome]
MAAAAPREAPEINVSDIVFPVSTNHLGTMFGGHVMAMMDKAAVLAAIRFARGIYVTVSSDSIQFHTPIQQGDLIEARARVAWVGNTSVIVKVEIFRESPFEEGRALCTTGWFALAARDKNGKPQPVPQILLGGDAARADHAQAAAFRARSLEQKASRG